MSTSSNIHDEARDFWGTRQKTIRYLILLLSLIESLLSHHAPLIMRNPRRECMNKELLKWNMVSSLPLCSALQVGRLATIFYMRLASMLAAKRHSPMPQQWAGYAANCLSLCSALQSFTSEAPDHASTTSLNCQSQLIWQLMSHVWPCRLIYVST